MLTLLEQRLSALHTALLAAGLPLLATAFNDANATPPTIYAKWSAPLDGAAQATFEAIRDGWDWSDAAALTYTAQQAKAAATSGIDSGDTVAGDKLERIVRAVALVALDAVNTDRQWIADFKAAVAAASSLANLQTRVAAIGAPPQVTAAQLVSAVKAKIAASAE